MSTCCPWCEEELSSDDLPPSIADTVRDMHEAQSPRCRAAFDRLVADVTRPEPHRRSARTAYIRYCGLLGASIGALCVLAWVPSYLAWAPVAVGVIAGSGLLSLLAGALSWPRASRVLGR
ncbi:MAG TPA: hypothetical protein VF288_10635 [Mycobacteriales bacterium]